jgi:uncharacterized membrane protein YkvA (DUF1232 family)
MIEKIKKWVEKLKNELIILHLAYKDQRTPWYAKAVIVLIIAYALSPIDLIPDFIPVLGYLDDIILLPLGIYMAIKMIPEQVMIQCRMNAPNYNWNKKHSSIGLILVLSVWFLVLLFLLYYIKS